MLAEWLTVRSSSHFPDLYFVSPYEIDQKAGRLVVHLLRCHFLSKKLTVSSSLLRGSYAGHYLRRHFVAERDSSSIATFTSWTFHRSWEFLRQFVMSLPITCYNLNVPVDHRPRYLFFVQHGSSQSSINPSGGFDAADTVTTPHSRSHLELLIGNHVNWACRVTSIFISAFGSFNRAYDWAMQRDPPVTIHHIDTANIHPDVLIFRAFHFVPMASDNEYLFLHRIHGSFIVQRYSLCHPDEQNMNQVQA